MGLVGVTGSVVEKVSKVVDSGTDGTVLRIIFSSVATSVLVTPDVNSAVDTTELASVLGRAVVEPIDIFNIVSIKRSRVAVIKHCLECNHLFVLHN